VADATRVVDAMAPFRTGRQYLNFAENPVDPATAYSAPTWQRLREIRSTVDPHGLFVANHPIPAAL
jgi:FAD/FMN-containing dehydrogenase